MQRGNDNMDSGMHTSEASGLWPIDTAGIQFQVVSRLRQRIISGELAPGTRLSEASLAEAFGLSRTPIREALKQLQVEGLVRIVPRTGTFVFAPSRREIMELFQIKEMLEGLGARLLAQRGRVPEIERLEHNYFESEKAIEDGDVYRYTELNDEFHQLIVNGADNGKLREHYQVLMNQLGYSRLVYASLSRPERLQRSSREHKETLNAILAKDAEGAEIALREHVRRSGREMMTILPLIDKRFEQTEDSEESTK